MSRVLSQVALDKSNVFFHLGYEEPNFKYLIFYCHIYGNTVEENMKYQQLQKICGEKVCCMKRFSGESGQFRHNILCTPKLCLFLYLWFFETPEGCWSVIFPVEN